MVEGEVMARGISLNYTTGKRRRRQGHGAARDGGAAEAAEAIQNGSRAVKRMIGGAT